MKRWVSGVFALIAGCAPGCSPNPDVAKSDADAATSNDAEGGGGSAVRICDPGQSSACACTDGRAGAQQCAADNLRWLDCECQGAPASGGTVGTGGSSGGSSGGTGGSGASGGSGGDHGSGGKPQPDVDAGESLDSGLPPDAPPAVGAFIFRLVAPVPAQDGVPAIEGVTTLIGRVNDGPTPSLVVWTPTRFDDTCRVLEPSIPFCDPSCVGGRVCVAADTCQAYPQAHSVGSVHVDGVRTRGGATAFDVAPLANLYQYTESPFPGFDEGGDLRLDTAGGDYAPFSVSARGVAPLDVPTPEFALVRGQPLSLTWGAPGLAEVSTIHVRVDISHHGGSRGTIECDAPDTGRLEIPAAMVDDLLNLGAAGFPVVQLSRRHVGATEIGLLQGRGRVELIVTSDVERPVSVPGIISCTDDSQCPNGQRCQADLSCAPGEPQGDAGLPPDSGPPCVGADCPVGCPGALGCPCGSDLECPAGACDGGRCVPTCEAPDDCAAGEACTARLAGPAVCRDGEALLCRACQADSDCGAADSGNRCIAHGALGRFCGTVCDAGRPCPEGYTCNANQCAPAAGAACACPAWFRDFVTVCTRTNVFGACAGERTCATECSAPEPAAEDCNGLDDDCDGVVDGTPAGALTRPCAQDNQAGVCAGSETCDEGQWVGCDAPTPSEEACDGADNDCDGEVDDDLSRACSVTSAFGTCEGAERCRAAEWRGCDARTPAAETCDGLDENCDGEVDEDLSRACQVANPFGACQGTETCAGGGWIGCTAAAPVAEICDDGIDNNCDGHTDEDCGCAPGATTTCYTGPAVTRGVGACVDGLATCGADRQFGPCMAQVLPGAELCNGRDDDCNGTLDDGLNRACQVSNPAGVCAGTESCRAGQWVGCNAATPAAETCDNTDNNCSGVADEALSRACSVANAFGACNGTEACSAGGWVGCTAATPVAEACDGIDNNCIGGIDEGLSRACQVVNGFGTCAGTESCGAGAWRGCTARTPAAEACDGLDNDCDGAIDETCLPIFSFFVTSLVSLQALSGNPMGFGGDLRFGQVGANAGLRGADMICAAIAELSMPGASVKGWHAFLSATSDGAGHPVNAIDRIGNGPWYDRLGRLLANNRAELLFDRPQNAHPAIINDFPNEYGVPNHRPDPNQPAVDNHDMLTGSNLSGTLYSATATCLDWTTTSMVPALTGRPRVGHSWPRPCGPGGGDVRSCNWMSALNEAGCGAGINLIETGPPNPNIPTVGSGGGYGGFYCFAVSP